MDKSYLEKKLKSSRQSLPTSSSPLIFNLSLRRDQDRCYKLIKERPVKIIIDSYKSQLEEYFQIKNPTKVYSKDFGELFKKFYESLLKRRPLWQQGRWIYYPWNNTLVHVLEENKFLEVRTARNRNLITPKEQSKFYKATIGVVGLSVGNSVALAIALGGGAKHMRLADHDTLALSNTNRIRGSITNLGLPKTIMTARQIYEINPYARLELFPEGLNSQNIERFFGKSSKLDIIIDEVDNLAIKYLIRKYAQKYRVSVLMGADNGDNAVVDIERYDLNPRLNFFHGRMGKISYDFLLNLDKFGIGKYITKHVGPENVTERMRNSLLEMGKTIVSWPQLGGAAMLNGSAIAYCARKIINGEKIENNRALISLDEKLIPSYNSLSSIRTRKKTSESFKKIFGL